MTRLGAWLRGLRPTPLLERPVLAEFELVVLPDGSARLTVLHETVAPAPVAAQIVAAAIGAIAQWGAQQGVTVRLGGE